MAWQNAFQAATSCLFVAGSGHASFFLGSTCTPGVELTQDDLPLLVDQVHMVSALHDLAHVYMAHDCEHPHVVADVHAPAGVVMVFMAIAYCCSHFWDNVAHWEADCFPGLHMDGDVKGTCVAQQQQDDANKKSAIKNEGMGTSGWDFARVLFLPPTTATARHRGRLFS
jgi:hypothetical protein